MKKIKDFESFQEGVGKITNYLNRILRKGGEFASNVWEATKIEGKETRIAVEILGRLIKGEEVSVKEKSFLKEQSKDLARIIPLVAISGIPIPIPITPLLIVLGKKYGFDFIPKDHRGILNNEVQLTLDLQEIIKSQPEKGMGYHIVDLILKNGRVLSGRRVLNGSILILNPGDTLNIEDIEDIIIE
jgi:hypothetical protein